MSNLIQKIAVVPAIVAGLALGACAGTNARWDSEQEYVHQFNAPKESYKIHDADFDSQGRLFYFKILQDNGLVTYIELNRYSKIESITLTNALRDKITRVRMSPKGDYEISASERGKRICIDGKCEFPAEVSQYQTIADSYAKKSK